MSENHTVYLLRLALSQVLSPGITALIMDRWLPAAASGVMTATSGFVAVVWALHVCSFVSMFGFGPATGGMYFKGRPTFEHTTITRFHNFTAELDILHGLQRQRLLRFW